MHQVIQIVPHLPPTISGVGDYAVALARQLRQDFGIQTIFVTFRQASGPNDKCEGFLVKNLSDSSSQQLIDTLSNFGKTSSRVLLHYVGYGYANRGCPFWLVNGIRKWKKEASNSFLLTMFHELYGLKAPWNSSFWLSYFHRRLIVSLLKSSDNSVTNLEEYARRISLHSGGKHLNVSSIAVFSSIGELDQLPPSLAERIRCLVIFGRSSKRRKIYLEAQKEILETCKLLEIEEIWDVGASTGLSLSQLLGVAVKEFGILEAAEISQLLKISFAAFLSYNISRLGKSTIFSAYCAHGVLTVFPFSRSPLCDGLRAGNHCIMLPNLHTQSNICFTNVRPSEAYLQAIANNAYLWYQSHNLSKHGQFFAQNLGI